MPFNKIKQNISMFFFHLRETMDEEGACFPRADFIIVQCEQRSELSHDTVCKYTGVSYDAMSTDTKVSHVTLFSVHDFCSMW